jgi:hypothetical protein
MSREGYDPNQPRDEIGRWTIAGNAARRASGLAPGDQWDAEEGDTVTISGNVQGKGKKGVIVEVSPSGNYFGVNALDGSGFLGYFHISDLTPYYEEDEDEEDEGEDEDEDEWGDMFADARRRFGS